MTIIVGVEYENEVWLGGEAEISDEKSRSMLSRPKVWKKDGLVWGFAGESRPGDLVRYSLTTPKLPKTNSHEAVGQFVILELIPSIKLLLTRDCQIQDNAPLAEFSALVGIRGELWYLDSDGFSGERCIEGYSAAGCGSTAALVGLSLTQKLTPRVRLTRVISAVSRHVVGCGGKITIVREGG